MSDRHLSSCLAENLFAAGELWAAIYPLAKDMWWLWNWLLDMFGKRIAGKGASIACSNKLKEAKIFLISELMDLYKKSIGIVIPFWQNTCRSELIFYSGGI